MIETLSNDFVLSFAVEGLAVTSASARFRVWTQQRLRGKSVILATQLPQSEYQGPSITEVAPFAIKAMCSRFGPDFIFVEHYNRASYGLDLFEPTFNHIRYVIEAAGVKIVATPAIAITNASALLGLTESELRRL